MEIDRRTLIALMVILFLFASWGLGVVLNTTPEFSEEEFSTSRSEHDLRPVLIGFLIIATIGMMLKGRTPTYIFAILFLPAVLFAASVILIVGFSWSLFVIILAIGISAVAIWKGVKEDNMAPYLVFIAGIGIFIYAMTYLGGGGGLVPMDYGGGGEAPSILEDPGGFVDNTFGGFGTFMLIILVGGILVFLLVQRLIPLIKSSGQKEEEEKGLEDQLSSTVDRAVTELRKGKDVHSSILRCYQRMCMILEEEGAEFLEFMTPREFEKQAISTLEVPASKITEIREVFELAKYSNNELGEEERDKAMKALKELREELG